MKFSALSRTGFAVALSAVLASMMAPAQAETVDSIFAKVSPSVRDRMFFRLNYVLANVKTSSGEARDVTGPVMGKNDIADYLRTPNYTSAYFTRSDLAVNFKTKYFQLDQVAGAIDDDLTHGFDNEAGGLGTPKGIKAKGQDTVGTPVLSVGYFLSEDYSWFLEAMVLAAPLKVTVKGDGVNGSGLPNGINGKDIIKLKMLPPIGILGYYFGEKGDVIRPFAGLGASYAMFFDVRATETLNAYQGGLNSGDTTINLKNSFGVGPFLGVKAEVTDAWHIGVSLGKLRYKTEATITTRNTTITSAAGVLLDYGPAVVDAINVGRNMAAFDANGVRTDGVTALMCDLAAAKGISNTCNYGTYVRKQSTVMDTTMLMLSIGRSF
ncbi:MAG: hypothetical protein HY019_04520 [Aquabacterium sp.]|uniref:OmpW/AlkL family protein n=1 Tax=Aquabacterium sp. TaxID=1872578 RepID=UPI0025BAE18C|nr:OmpW family outer membrane protein [Aquabacterium sp.]MBI3381253.1 hypothetical protein [Aquabacterium sp.]